MIKYGNIRTGFATNSSSTHSIIIRGTGKGHSPEDRYGWDQFLCDTKEEKSHYLAASLYSSINDEVGEDNAALIAKSLFNVEEIGGGVDHQSRLDCPMNFHGHINLEFWKQFSKSIIEDDKIAIQGGNDNEEYPQGQKDEKYHWTGNITESDRDKRPIASQSGNVWTLFNKNCGTKVHLSFQGEVPKDFRPLYPELVDLKITDYCPYNCSYCYQSSTLKGKHADLEDIKNAIPYTYNNKGLFEIALGGGEPTLHPNFVEILEYIRKQGMIPNFTTKNTQWLKRDVEKAKKILELTGGFAVSVENDYQIKNAQEDLKAFLRVFDHSTSARMSFQYILDAHPFENFKQVVKQANAGWGGTLTLLGYKSCGRGGKRPHANPEWLKYLLDQDPYKIPSIGIDTQLAQDYKTELQTHAISDRFFYTEEGRFSMYVDVVEKKYAPSSFGEASSYKPLPSYFDYTKLFATLN